ncbi:MAG: site-2 protease family protein [Candidatus Uhrbacteria bacterium]
MPINIIFEQPAIGLAWVVAILIALAIHEAAHAAAASALGDQTARDAGRLTLNPIAHLDPIGFIALLFIGFGWGKPVPFDARQLRYPRWGPALVAIAGPAANLIGLIVSGLVLRVFENTAALSSNNLLVFALAFFFQINLVLLLFNCIPIPPLDGSKVLLGALDRPQFDQIRFFLETRGPFMLIALLIIDSMLGGALFGRGLHAALNWAAGLF